MAKTFKDLMEEARREVPEWSIDQVKEQLGNGHAYALAAHQPAQAVAHQPVCRPGGSEVLWRGSAWRKPVRLRPSDPQCDRTARCGARNREYGVLSRGQSCRYFDVQLPQAGELRR